MKALRIGLRVLIATLLVVLALAGALWLWSGASTSLATALAQAVRYLPPGQTLEVKEVKGSLLGGGQIGWLRWTLGNLSVEASEVRVAWTLRPLMDGELRLDQLTARHLRIDDRRPPSAPTPPADLRLPFKVDIPFAVDTLEWSGPPALHLTGLAGHYVFDSYSHLLNGGYAHISSGNYQFKASLQAQAPMALSLQVQGTVQTTAPSSPQSLTLQAHAELQGTLAGRDAALALQAQLLPKALMTSKKSPPASQLMQASLNARIQPWQPQPIAQATAHWQALNLAALWPQAPQTRLNGDATVTPAGPGWRAGIQLVNTQSGPWQQQRLPLDRLNAKVVYLKGQWVIESLQANGAGARLAASGKLTPSPRQWQGKASLSLPGATATLDGHMLSASGQGEMRLRVADVALATRWLQQWPGAPAALHQDALQGNADITGHWQQQGPTLQIQARVDAAQLTVQDTPRSGAWRLQLDEKLALDWKQTGTSQTLTVAAGTARLSGPVPGTALIHWQPAHWSQQKIGTQEQTRWQTQGQLQNLPLPWLELLGKTQMANLGLRGDLLFGGQWDASGGDAMRLSATLERTAGDLQLQTADTDAKTGSLRAGVREARLQITSHGEQVAASLRWDSERAGQAQATLGTRLQHQGGTWRWPADAPLTGTLRAQLPPVGAWSVLAPPGWRLRGTLDADATLSGTRSTPLWRGTLQARDLAVRSVVDGLDFSNGALRASLEGQRLNIDDFTLQGAGGNGGTLSAKGTLQWLPATGPTATLTSRLHLALDATAQALRVSTRADRRLVVSGHVTARLNEARLEIRGKLKADQALFTLPEDTTPQLGDDVRVRTKTTNPFPSEKTPAPATTAVRVTPDVALTLDFGSDFQVRGRGLLTRLAGSLELRSTPETEHVPSLTGDLHTVRGTYKAYGQQLDIEQGLLRFTGLLNNPALDILAIRPNLQQRVGVQISGTALSPVVRLYAEPDLPEAEKLAWLVLGRSAANGGAEAAVLQQAALALLGGSGKGLSGSLSEALGLDELSMRGATSNADGSSATGASVTLGKRISREFYVAYERSLAGTLGTFYLFYDLSRRFTLRAQTGEQSAVDLIYTFRYD